MVTQGLTSESQLILHLESGSPHGTYFSIALFTQLIFVAAIDVFFFFFLLEDSAPCQTMTSEPSNGATWSWLMCRSAPSFRVMKSLSRLKMDLHYSVYHKSVLSRKSCDNCWYSVATSAEEENKHLKSSCFFLSISSFLQYSQKSLKPPLCSLGKKNWANIIDGASGKWSHILVFRTESLKGSRKIRLSKKPVKEKIGRECLLFATAAALVCAYCVTAAEVKFDCGEANALCLTAFSALAAVVGWGQGWAFHRLAGKHKNCLLYSFITSLLFFWCVLRLSALRLLPPREWAFAARRTNVAIVTEYNGSRLVHVTRSPAFSEWYDPIQSVTRALKIRNC